MARKKPLTRISRKNGELDDIAIEEVSLFRLEMMDRNSVWICLYRGTKRFTLDIYSTPEGIKVVRREDELGCIYHDTK